LPSNACADGSAVYIEVMSGWGWSVMMCEISGERNTIFGNVLTIWNRGLTVLFNHS